MCGIEPEALGMLGSTLPIEPCRSPELALPYVGFELRTINARATASLDLLTLP